MNSGQVGGSNKLFGGLFSIVEQWPYLRYLGLGAWWAWIWLWYNSIEIMRFFPEEVQTTQVLYMYLASTSGIALIMLMAAAFWRQITPIIDNNKVVMIFGIVAGLSTLLLGFSHLMEGQTIFVIAAVLTGIGTSILCLKMGRLYGSVALREGLTAGSISLLLASFFYFMGIGLPEAWRIFFIAALPVFSALFFVLPGDDPFPAAFSDKEGSLDRKNPARKVYFHLIIASVIVALVAGIGKGISSTTLSGSAFAESGAVIAFCTGVIGILIALAINGRDITEGTRWVYSALMVLGIGIILASFLGLNFAYLNIAKESLWLVFSCIMAYMAFRFDFSPVRFFGIGQAAYFISSTIGWAIGANVFVNLDVTLVNTVVCGAFAFLLVFVLVFVFTESDIRFITGRSTKERDSLLEAQEESATAENEYDQKHIEARFGASYGLSQREIEILLLFAQGRSANWIADNLTISKNTVRSHLRTIYNKLDIHTRQELLDFLKAY